MKLRTKSILVICVGFSMLCLVLSIVLNSVILRSYSDLEIKTVSEHVQRILNQIEKEKSDLERTAYDWSAWDDTYFFVEDKNEEYIQNNLQYESLAEIDINLMAFYDNSDSLVFSKCFDFNQKNEILLPDKFYIYISENKEFLLNNTDVEDSKTGYILYDEQESSLLISITPIVNSTRGGPIHGSLILGRFLDKAKVESIGNITQSMIILHPLSIQNPKDSEHVTTDVLGKTVYIQLKNSTYIAGYVTIDDVFGNPIFIIEIGSNRAIYNQGQNVIQNLILLLVITVITLIIIVVIVLDRFITSRLTSLSNSVNNVKKYEDLSKLLKAKGNDEIAVLEKNINTMLTSLQKTWAMKDSAEFSLQKKIDELERFKTITVDREIKMIELKKEIEELKNKSLEKT